LLHKIGNSMLGKTKQELSPSIYHRMFQFQIRVSQLMLWMSLILALIGPMLSMFSYNIHGEIMMAAISMFYIGIMYSQHPGFTNFMPDKMASIAMAMVSITWSITLMVGTWLWRPLAASWALLYIAIFMQNGLGSKPLYFPNWFTLVGLLGVLGASFTGFQWGLIGFPIASVISLLRRVNGKMRMGKLDLLVLPLYPVIASLLWLNYARVIFLFLIIFSLGLPSSLPRSDLSSALPVGLAVAMTIGIPAAGATILMKWPSILYFHALALGFLAPIMLSLCVPMLLPGTLWIWPKNYSEEIPALIGASAILRLLSYYYGNYALIASLMALYASLIIASTHYLRGKRIKVL